MRRFIAKRMIQRDSPAASGRWNHGAKSARRAILLALLGCCLSGPSPLPSVFAEELRNRSDRETPIVLAIRRCSNAVVNIHGQKVIRNTAAAMAGGDGNRQVNGMGTGVVIDPRGYVITNYHVVEDVAEVRITLADGTQTRAELVATDVRSDLALLKVDVKQPLPVIPRGTSSDLMVGEPVIAIGNAFGYEHTVTEGIISALHRNVPVNDAQDYRDLIQTSAGINPGNSGGPLLNIHGEIIGVNVAVRVGAQQIAFAIPIDQAVEIVNAMILQHNEQRLGLGLAVAADTQAGNGVVITQVTASGVASREGLRTGDRIVQVGSTATANKLDFGLALIETQHGGSVPMVIERDGQRMELAVTAGPAAAAESPAYDENIAWNAIGVRVQPVSRAALQSINTKTGQEYRGGLYVTEVRSGSPAELNGLRSGDVLIGLHGWSTASLAELHGILVKASEQDQTQSKFVIVRSDQPMYGYLRLADGSASRSR